MGKRELAVTIYYWHHKILFFLQHFTIIWQLDKFALEYDIKIV